MSTTIQATYSNGFLTLAGPLPLADNSVIQVTIELPTSSLNGPAFEELSTANLLTTWDNPEDDVFNALR